MREKLHRERQVLSAKAKHPVENVKEKPKKKNTSVVHTKSESV